MPITEEPRRSRAGLPRPKRTRPQHHERAGDLRRERGGSLRREWGGSLRTEWGGFRRLARLTALAAAALAIIALGLLPAFASSSSCEGPCPGVPVTADGATVSDSFWFLHRDLGREGSITVRLTSMTGTITYPPPDHDSIVPGLVPWAKTGIIVKDGLRQGSRYAALAMTGGHGVRFQYDYEHDVAGSPGPARDGVAGNPGAGPVQEGAPRWLRLTRSGDTITGAESADGKRWSTVGTARLDGLPDTVQVGLFAASPGDLTLREVALGGAVEEVRFTQAVGVFDHVTVEGGAAGAWESDGVGVHNMTDWEKLHNPAGAVVKDGVVTVSGSGDIGPISDEGARAVEQTLTGLVAGLIILLVAAARYGARTARDASPRHTTTAHEAHTQPVATADMTREVLSRHVIAARAAIAGAAAFVTGLVAVGVVLPVGLAVLQSNGVPVQAVPPLTGVRVVVGVTVAFALSAVLAYGLGVWLRRPWPATVAALSLVALPYTLAAFPLLPDTVAEWLLRVTPAAGFAVKQTMVEYPQVTAHYAPSAGYFPLPWWAGLAVLGAYAVIVVRLALGRGQGDDQKAGRR